MSENRTFFLSNPPFRKLVGKMFLATRGAFLDSPTIAEIVYVIFNLVARLMLDLYALYETQFTISRSSRGRKYTFFSSPIQQVSLCFHA